MPLIEFAICIKSLPTFACLTRGSGFESPLSVPIRLHPLLYSRGATLYFLNIDFFQSKGHHSSSFSVIYFAILKGICCCVSLCLGFMQSSVDRIWFSAVVGVQHRKKFEVRDFLGSRKQPETEFSFNCSPSIVSLCFIYTARKREPNWPL